MKGFKTTLIRLATALIPAKRVRKRLRRRLLDAERAEWLAKTVPAVRAHAADVEAQCRAKLARGERLTVAFLVCDASMFSGESVYLRLRDDPRFDCFIAVAPRVTRGEAFLKETLAKTVGSLTAKYGSAVRSLYDETTGKGLPLEADVVFSTILYEDQSFADYTTERLSRKSLVAILYYGYGGLFTSNEKKTPFLPNIVLAWRYFVSNAATREMNVAKNPLLRDNIVVAGYCKMDRLEKCRIENEEWRLKAGASVRKKIIICPHHSIDRETDGLALSTFLKTGETLLKLPALFPEIDFVFRPHPLLFVRLATPKWWGPKKTSAYVAKMESYPNVEFQRGGDYFATFAESDALIHDCGSFLAEYFYTGKPQCYLLESERTVEEQFLPFSKNLLAHAHRAFTEEEIVGFVRSVVLAGNDPDKPARDAFAAKEVCINHPHATDAVIAELTGRRASSVPVPAGRRLVPCADLV